MNKELLKRMIRVYFDSIPTRYRGELQRTQATEELIELCYELELDTPFITQLIKDSEVK